MHVLVAGSAAPTHIRPHLSVVGELVRRGHRVTYAVDERCFDLIRPTGADLVHVPSTLPINDWPSDPARGMAVFLADSLHALPLVHALADAGGGPPDVVLHDIGGAHGPVLAFDRGVPAVQLSPTFVAWEGYEEDMADMLAELVPAMRAQAPYARFASLMAERGMTGAPDDLLGRPARGLVLVPRVLQPNAERVSPERFRFVGPALDLDRLASPFRRPEGVETLVYVAFGTAFNDQPEALAEVLAAFGGRDGWHVVVATGPTALDRAALVRNVTAFEVAPQLAVLAAADVFVTHAGMGSVSEALWFGVPMVCLPQAVDQPTNAATVQALGLGLAVERAADLPDAVARVAADGTIRDAARVASAAVRAEGGAGRAADAIEEVVSGAW